MPVVLSQHFYPKIGRTKMPNSYATIIVERIHATGGSCLYNNNVDLLACHGERRTLIEAKSLNDLHDTVDRMRYGIGQLADYAYRYRDTVRGGRSVLAFGRPPDRATNWIADVLQANDVAFVALDANAVVPLNDHARALPFMHA